MTPLRQRMLDEMKLAGLMASTQKVYVREVRRLAAYYRRCPAELSQDEVRRYLLAVHGRGVAQACICGGEKTDWNRGVESGRYETA